MSAKPMVVKRIKGCASISDAEVGRCLEAQTSENPIACLNWPAYPYKPDVRFRVGHVGSEIWLAFYVKETRIRARETRTHGEVYKDSCVEFFVSFDRTNYYNFECNCIGTTHLAYGPGRADRTFIPLPLMKRVSINPSLGRLPFEERSGDFEWTLTARLPVSVFAFDALSSLDGVSATANFYKIGGDLSVQHYLTWMPVATPAPDYHRPEFFRDIVFE
jgi:hypothetical protein